MGKKRGSRGRTAGLLGGGRSPGRSRPLPWEEPLPGHRRPQERPPPTGTLANQSAVCLGDGREPVQGGRVCGAVTLPAAGSAQTSPPARAALPLLRLCPPVCGQVRAQGGWRGMSPWTQLCRTHAYTSSLPAQRQGELGAPSPPKRPILGLRGTGSAQGADSSPPLGLSASPPVRTRRVPAPPTGTLSPCWQNHEVLKFY